MSRSHASDPDGAALALDQARAAVATDRAEAIRLAHDATTLAPADHTTLLDAAVVMLAAGDAAGADGILTQLAPLIRSGPPGFVARALGVGGYVKLALGEDEQATRALAAAFDIDPAPEWAIELAPLLVSQHRPDEARAVITSALADSPDDAELSAMQARIAGEAGLQPHSRTHAARLTWSYGDWQRLG